jgi:hypothetical protein
MAGTLLFKFLLDIRLHKVFFTKTPPWQVAAPRGWCRWLGYVVWLTTVAGAAELNLMYFMAHERLTPRRFAAYFETFDYDYADEVQPPDEFLSRRRGDCDDYAIVANIVLGHHGYDTRLVHVRLVGRVAHAVCQLPEARLYLDFNRRSFLSKLSRSGPSLREIAQRVADTFEANWTSVSEFTYDQETGRKQIIQTVVKAAPRQLDSDVRRN